VRPLVWLFIFAAGFRQVLDVSIIQAMGRRRLQRWGPRTLDIDVLTYGAETTDEADLKAPDPRMAERAFVLAPLAEISPDLRIADQEIVRLLALVDC